MKTITTENVCSDGSCKVPFHPHTHALSIDVPETDEEKTQEKQRSCRHLWDEYETKDLKYLTNGNNKGFRVTKVFCKNCLLIKNI